LFQPDQMIVALLVIIASERFAGLSEKQINWWQTFCFLKVLNDKA